eukprot:CAMPEP_0116572194 /NCGR_PEP_ID=MMETSP0397-20121206/18029_1 /TAXON_ID=216820 /ORGANISM="Cyclophora tenuis, Strain ECT3854" /LENGTH=107 /DNA_ID=CAMNT_0004100473 /DNA_START=154 /DNA_END=477 /DNA_ORIENTATION=-
MEIRFHQYLNKVNAWKLLQDGQDGGGSGSGSGSIPMGVWPMIIANLFRSSSLELSSSLYDNNNNNNIQQQWDMDIVYFLLRNKPNLFLTTQPRRPQQQYGEKRKRTT